jgi:hypothetical protein
MRHAESGLAGIPTPKGYQELVLRNFNVAIFFNYPSISWVTRDCAQGPRLGENLIIALEPPGGHAGTSIVEKTRFVNKILLVLNDSHWSEPFRIHFFMPMTCLPVLVDGFASILWIKPQMCSNTRIRHLLMTQECCQHTKKTIKSYLSYDLGQ